MQAPYHGPQPKRRGKGMKRGKRKVIISERRRKAEEKEPGRSGGACVKFEPISEVGWKVEIRSDPTEPSLLRARDMN